MNLFGSILGFIIMFLFWKFMNWLWSKRPWKH